MQIESPSVQFIAEISANHLGSLDRAKELVRLAAKSGATAVKFQTYKPETMTLDVPQFSVSSEHELWGGRNLFQLYEEAQTPWEWHKPLFDLARELGISPFSSPFDINAVELLESLDVSMYKIASLESGDLRLIRAVADTGKPLIISTGATKWEEIEDAVNVVNQSGNKDLTLLVCTSSYPSLPGDAHLSRMTLLKSRFGCKVGVSDHTLGIGVAIAGIALGASAIEKHLTIRRADGGADGQFSLEPEEFRQLVTEGKSAYESIGKSEWQIQESENESRRLRRSLIICQDVAKGDPVTLSNVKSLRPAVGIAPKFLESALGSIFNDNYKAGTPFNFEVIN